ncbi:MULTISPECIES: hypothetical protein [unclassified Rhodococcus (in: high G+C Gram-positive bacteria)]|uniref:hypothetical protein n=1 Tax=unclassified Rhodococcus (in: high G+C Gram-positive bacteria) TaxID=192944 RepID=UPI003394F613
MEQELRLQVHPIVCAHAGIDVVGEAERRTTLGNYDGSVTVELLASIQSRLDVATTTDWSQGDIERALLREAEQPWSATVSAKTRTNGRLVPPRSLTQLIREALENSVSYPDADPIQLETVLRLIMSINTEHDRNEFSEDGTLTPDAEARIARRVLGMNLEQSIDLMAQIALDEIANFQGNAPLKLEVLQADTQNMWFSPWPERVTDPRLGASPADCFREANGVELIDVLVLGTIVADGARRGQNEYTREELVAAGATEGAVDLLFDEMALPLKQFKKRLAKDRARGAVADQRYTLTERPFVALDNGNVRLLRYQWAIDRFFGAQLYWQTFFRLGEPLPGSVAESFSLAMNDMFERAVADVLESIIASSTSMQRIVHENEMQAAWIERGEKPSVCDFVVPSRDGLYLVMDATNHHLNFKFAQGLGTIEQYEQDAKESLLKKCDQIAKTIRQLRSRSDFGATERTVFVPIVVVPVNGVPNLGITEGDLIQRSRGIFEDLARTQKIYSPTVIRLQDLELLEGIAEWNSSESRDVLELISHWRREAMTRTITGRPPSSLQEVLDAAGIQRPIPSRMFAARSKLTTAIAVRLAVGRSQ